MLFVVVCRCRCCVLFVVVVRCSLLFLPHEAAMLTRFWDRNFVRPSVCPSVCHTRVCDETIEHAADIFIPHERVIILVFWYQRTLVGDVPFHPKFALKLNHPL